MMYYMFSKAFSIHTHELEVKVIELHERTWVEMVLKLRQSFKNLLIVYHSQLGPQHQNQWELATTKAIFSCHPISELANLMIPHSLSFLPSIQQTFNTNPKCRSTGSQLPLQMMLHAPVSGRSHCHKYFWFNNPYYTHSQAFICIQTRTWGHFTT